MKSDTFIVYQLNKFLLFVHDIEKCRFMKQIHILVTFYMAQACFITWTSVQYYTNLHNGLYPRDSLPNNYHSVESKQVSKSCIQDFFATSRTQQWRNPRERTHTTAHAANTPSHQGATSSSSKMSL